MTRVALYARYSSDSQREASIEDQVRTCRARAEREGWTVTQVFTDYGISGATQLRPGYQRLLEEARTGAFDLVLAEALDRLSRDQEHVAGLYKQLSFAGVGLVTLAEGEISELHVGLKGTMNALFLKDLAQKTRRGQEGRVRDGRSAGGRCYGYRVVREFDHRGEPVRGGRSIDEAEAAIVRRVFREFAAGLSPRAIACRLNAEGVPGPEGGVWQGTTLRGHHARRTGLLRNELYIGRIVWNRMRFIKDPATGKRVSRPNPEREWVNEEVPHLRIVDQELWETVQARLGEIRSSPKTAKLIASGFWLQRRPRHLLTGKAFCGRCGGPLAAVGKDYLACAAARGKGTCANRKGIRRDALSSTSWRPANRNCPPGSQSPTAPCPACTPISPRSTGPRSPTCAPPSPTTAPNAAKPSSCCVR
jgi:DNA invertase Pin-like site-specific DNA recombinase